MHVCRLVQLDLVHVNSCCESHTRYTSYPNLDVLPPSRPSSVSIAVLGHTTAIAVCTVYSAGCIDCRPPLTHQVASIRRQLAGWNKAETPTLVLSMLFLISSLTFGCVRFALVPPQIHSVARSRSKTRSTTPSRFETAEPAMPVAPLTSAWARNPGRPPCVSMPKPVTLSLGGSSMYGEASNCFLGHQKLVPMQLPT